MPRKPSLEVRSFTIANNTTVQVLPKNIYRDHILVKFEGTNFYVAYQDNEPPSNATMTLIDTNYRGEFFDPPGSTPTSNVWIRNESGAAAAFKVRTDQWESATK